MTKLHAEGKNIILAPVQEQKVGGMDLVSTFNSLSVVLSVGSKVENINVKEGDKVYIQPNAGTLINHNSEEVLIVHEDSVLCKESE